MIKFLQFLGGLFLGYSIAGIVVHILSKFEGFGHYCDVVIFFMEENHLYAYTVTAAISATFFLMAKGLKKRKLKKAF